MSDQERDILDLLTLQMTPGVGPQRIAALLERFGTASAALRAGVPALADVPGVGAKTAAALREPGPRQAAVAEVERARKDGVRLLGRGGAGYPAWLASIPAAPPVLFVRGDILPADERAVAIVGTRHPTAAGKKLTQQLAAGLARAGVTVVSGLPQLTTLETWLNVAFSAEDVALCEEAPQFRVVRARGEGGKFAGSRRAPLGAGLRAT